MLKGDRATPSLILFSRVQRSWKCKYILCGRECTVPLPDGRTIVQVTWLASPRSEAQAHVCLPVRGAPGECYYNSLLCCDYFSSSSVVSRAFSALCVYSKFGRHVHPLGYLCAKFRFSRGLHCWANPWRKIAYSITHLRFGTSSKRSGAFYIYSGRVQFVPSKHREEKINRSISPLHSF